MPRNARMAFTGAIRTAAIDLPEADDAVEHRRTKQAKRPMAVR